MGVLFMSLPASTLLPGSLGRKRAPRAPSPAEPTRKPLPDTGSHLGTAHTAQLDSSPRSVPAHDTLLPPFKQVEATLDRSPQQIAEQEATLRLVRQCIAGEQHAWHQLVAGQHRRVYAICYRFTNSASDAEDLTQDVFLKVYRNLDSFDTQKGSFQTWLTTLARNLLVDHFRRTRLDRASDSLDASIGSDPDGPTMADRLADPSPSQEHHVAGLELKATIQEALKQLSPELREAVILRDLEDMDYKEIAQVLRIPEGTVKSRISRGRGELARLLQRIERQVN
jgi:RNA polymerase sigma-70 factor (ECF subfamily)